MDWDIIKRFQGNRSTGKLPYFQKRDALSRVYKVLSRMKGDFDGEPGAKDELEQVKRFVIQRLKKLDER